MKRATTIFRITEKIVVYRVLCLLYMVILVSWNLAADGQASGTSPYHSFYPDITTISTAELRDRLATVTLIDVRSKFEFDVVHIDNSINLPLADEQFDVRLDQLKEIGSELQLVVTSNDPDCSRAFRAARIAIARGITNVKVFDAGVYSWLLSHPDRTWLMGELPAQTERVLPLVSHQVHLVTYDRFLDMSHASDAIVIDLRDIFQRRIVPAEMTVRNITLHSFLEAIGSRVWAEKRLLFFDSNGSMVRWLQLFLQARGYHDFYFLEGGVDALPGDIIFRFVDMETSVVSIDPAELRETIKSLWHESETVEFMSFIIASMQFRNLSFVSHRAVEIRLGLDIEQIRNYSAMLTESGRLRFFEANGNFIYLVDPLLAWKGPMSGLKWQQEVNQFHNLHGE